MLHLRQFVSIVAKSVVYTAMHAEQLLQLCAQLEQLVNSAFQCWVSCACGSWLDHELVSQVGTCAKHTAQQLLVKHKRMGVSR